MATTLRDKLKSLSVERQEKIARRTADLIEEEKSLRELRESCGLTQEDVAELLGVPQGNVSRLENRRDWRLSTLRGYVKAMGGELHIVVKMPHGSPVRLADLSKGILELKGSADRKKTGKTSQKTERETQSHSSPQLK